MVPRIVSNNTTDVRCFQYQILSMIPRIALNNTYVRYFYYIF